jgi:hypothetical protein
MSRRNDLFITAAKAAAEVAGIAGKDYKYPAARIVASGAKSHRLPLESASNKQAAHFTKFGVAQNIKSEGLIYCQTGSLAVVCAEKDLCGIFTFHFEGTNQDKINDHLREALEGRKADLFLLGLHSGRSAKPDEVNMSRCTKEFLDNLGVINLDHFTQIKTSCDGIDKATAREVRREHEDLFPLNEAGRLVKFLTTGFGDSLDAIFKISESGSVISAALPKEVWEEIDKAELIVRGHHSFDLKALAPPKAISATSEERLKKLRVACHSLEE